MVSAEKAAAIQQAGKWPRLQPRMFSQIWPKPLCRHRAGAGHVLLRRGVCNVLPDASAFDDLLASCIQILILQLNEFSFQEGFGH